MKSKLVFLLFFGLVFNFQACRRNQDLGLELSFRAFVEIPPGLNPWMTHYFVIRDLPAYGLETGRTFRPGFIRIWLEEGEASIDFIRDAYLLYGADSNLVELGFREQAPMNRTLALDLLSSMAELRQSPGDTLKDLTLRLNFYQAPSLISRLRIEYTLFVQDN